MGLFLSISGVIDASALDIQATLAAFAANRSGEFELAQDSTDAPNVGVLLEGENNTTVLYPADFLAWDEASKFLSKSLNTIVFSFHIHDEDLWMYVLYQGGKEIGRFNPIPGYWKELPPKENARWKGDAAQIAALIPNVAFHSIARYLLEWSMEEGDEADEKNEPEAEGDEQDEIKAYPEDEFPANDCWQMCDFMKKVGFEYPLRDDGTVLGQTFRFWVKDPSNETA